MAKYRGKNKHREVHPKIFVWSHTKKAEIEYFQDFKNYLKTPLLMPKKEICWTPQELLEKIVVWKKRNISEEDGDHVWCIFDVDNFYKKDSKNFLKAIKNAVDNDIKIAYVNECFELWILLHFKKLTSAISRGDTVHKKIELAFKKNNLGDFIKNQQVFRILLPFQGQAIKNAKKILADYKKIDWRKMLSEEGNPSTSLHFLIEEIKKLIPDGKK